MKTYQKICLALFLLFSLVLFLQRENLTHTPWIKEQPLRFTGFAVGNGERTAIVANSAESIFVIGQGGERIYQLHAGSESRSFVSVEILELDDDNNLYVHDKIFGDAFGENTERILKYSPDGKFLGVFYSYTYDNLEFIVSRGKIRTMAYHDGFLYLARLENEGFYLEALNTRQPGEPPGHTFFPHPDAFRSLTHCRINPVTQDIVWSTKLGNLLQYDFSGTLIRQVEPEYGQAFYMALADDDGHIVYIDVINSEIARINTGTGERTLLLDETATDAGFYFYIQYKNGALFASFNRFDAFVLQDDGSSTHLNSFFWSGGQVALHWALAVLFVLNAVLFLALLHWGLHLLFSRRTSAVFKQILAVFVFVVLLAGLVFFFIQAEIWNNYIDSTHFELENKALLIAASIDVEFMLDYQTHAQFDTEEYRLLREYIERVLSQLRFENRQIYLLIWMERDGTVFSMYDLEYLWGPLYPYCEYEGSFYEVMRGSLEPIHHMASTSLGSWVVTSVPMLDANGELIAATEIGYNIQSVGETERILMMQVAAGVFFAALVFLALGVTLLLMMDAHKKNRIKTSFLANMSHEVRTPMNAILGITEIQLQSDGLSQDTELAFSKIYESGYLLLNIINDILDLSKIESGKLELVPVDYDIPSLINDTVQLNVAYIGSKRIEFKLDLDENLPSRLFGDELRIRQILNNLLSNSIKYSEEGFVKLSVSHSVLGDVILLRFVVEDTGQGMSPEDQKRLFTEYVRFNTSANRMTGGTGLGLNITKRLVEKMGGEISVKSERGKGSVFTVTVKQNPVECLPIGVELARKLSNFTFSGDKQAARLKIIREPMPYGRVLVVDDIETNLSVVEGLLLPYKIKTETAMSGFAAIEKVKSGKTYDVIFMDHMMPGMDGIEAVKIIRGGGYNEPIIALTANAVVGQADVFLQNGFDDFISKPIDIRQMDAALNRFVRDKQPHEVIEAARRESGSSKINTERATSPERDSLLMRSFVRDARKALATLEEISGKDSYELEQDLLRYSITVHGMKSALHSVGERALSDLAGQLEVTAKERSFELLREATPDFLKALRKLLEEVNPDKASGENESPGAGGDNAPAGSSGNENTGSGGKDDESEVLRDQLQQIIGMCAEYNRKGVLDVLTVIRQGSKDDSGHLSSKTRAVLDSIEEHVIHSDFDEAEAVAAMYAAELGISG